jgi:hypothetical protein
MIADRHTEKRTAPYESLGQLEILTARREIAGRMIVKDEHAARTIEKGLPEKVCWIHRGIPTGTQAEIVDPQEPAASVKAEKSNNLPALPLKVSGEKSTCRLGLIKGDSLPEPSLGQATPQLEGCALRCRLGLAHARSRDELSEVEARELHETSCLKQQLVREAQHTISLSAGPKQHGDKLGIRKGLWAGGDEPLPGSLGLLHLTDPRRHSSLRAESLSSLLPGETVNELTVAHSLSPILDIFRCH